MAKHIEHEVAYYYDFHPTEEDLMGETSVHATLVHYLIEVLTWLLEGQTCAVYENLNFYQTPNPKEYPLAPDIAVIKGVDFQHVRSWRGGIFCLRSQRAPNWKRSYWQALWLATRPGKTSHAKDACRSRWRSMECPLTECVATPGRVFAPL